MYAENHDDSSQERALKNLSMARVIWYTWPRKSDKCFLSTDHCTLTITVWVYLILKILQLPGWLHHTTIYRNPIVYVIDRYSSQHDGIKFIQIRIELNNVYKFIELHKLPVVTWIAQMIKILHSSMMYIKPIEYIKSVLIWRTMIIRMKKLGSRKTLNRTDILGTNPFSSC